MLGAARTDPTPTLSQELDGGDWILPLIKRAQERVMPQKVAVITMGMSKTQYIENLQGTGHLSVRRMAMLGRDFWTALAEEIRDHFGLVDDAERLQRARELRAKCDEVIDEIARKALR
jgi:hypothetical protein